MMFFSRYAKQRSRKAAVLMYHRVAEVAVDPWQLAVAPYHFAEQISVLKNKYPVISIGDLIGQLERGGLETDCVCITFDDGYLDNYLYAAPVLEEMDCPATFFIPTHFTGQTKAFWWDALLHLLLYTPTLPGELNLDLPGFAFRFSFLQANRHRSDSREAYRCWHYNGPVPDERCGLYLELSQLLKAQPLKVQEQVVDAIRKWAGNPAPEDMEAVPMNPLQLRSLQAAPGFDLGLHGHTHGAMAFLDPATLREELARNKKVLRELTGSSPEVLAYPYGNYDPGTLEVVGGAGIQAAFTTEASPVTSASRLLQLGRFAVSNLDGPGFEAALQGWFMEPVKATA